MSLVALIFALFLGLYLLFTFRLWWENAPYVPTPSQAVEIMIREAELKEGMIVMDLGCGNGQLLFQAAKAKPLLALGYELFLPLYLLAKLKSFFYFSPGKVKIFFQNFWQQDLGRADIIFCYLLPRPMARLEKKFLKEAKRGAKLISYAFALPHLQPQKVIQKEGLGPIYLYIKD